MANNIDVEALVHSMVGLITALITLAMLISVCRNFYCQDCTQLIGKSKKKKSTYYPAIRASSVICLIAIAIRLSTLFMLHIPYYCQQCNISEHTAIAWQLLSAFFLFLSKPLLQIHFVVRLYYTFRSSSFASNRSTYMILGSIITTEILCVFLYFISGLVQLRADQDAPLLVEDDFDDGAYKKAFESWFSISLLIIAIITDLIVSYIITHLFVSKLFNLLIIGIQSRHSDQLNVEIIHKKSSNLLEVSPSLSPTQSPKLSPTFGPKLSAWSTSNGAFSIMHVGKVKYLEKDKQMIDTITRTTLLSMMTMVFTQIYFIIQLVHILLIILPGDHLIAFKDLNPLIAALSITDSVLAICAIYLQFLFARKWYNRFCSICHHGLESLCKRMTERKVMQSTIDEDGYHLMSL